MLRHVVVVIALLFIVGPGFAKADIDGLRKAIFAGQFGNVEAMFDAAQHSDAAKAGDYSEQRDLIQAMQVSDPRVINFVADWMKAKPDSVHAKVARARLAWAAALWQSGHHKLGDISPPARMAMDSYMELGSAMAWAAFSADPANVGASDMVLRFSMWAPWYAPGSPISVLNQVMIHVPNALSIEITAQALRPMMGGSIEEMEGVCGVNAGKVNVPGYDAEVCLMNATFPNIGAYPFQQKLYGRLDRNPNPLLETAKRNKAISSGITSPKVIASLKAYLADPDVADTDAAGLIADLPGGFNHNRRQPDIYLEVMERKIAKAKVDLAFDPFNPTLLRIVAQAAAGYSPVAHRPTPEEQMAYLTKALVLAPYEPENWKDIAHVKARRSDMAAERFTADIYFGNAIAFSNHSFDYLLDFSEFAGERFAKMAPPPGKDRQHIIEPHLLTAELEKAICEAIRLYRLINKVCRNCVDGSSAGPQLADALHNAERLNICVLERTANLETLAYRAEDAGISQLPLP